MHSVRVLTTCLLTFPSGKTAPRSLASPSACLPSTLFTLNSLFSQWTLLPFQFTIASFSILGLQMFFPFCFELERYKVESALRLPLTPFLLC